MKRYIPVITPAILAVAMASPAFAQGTATPVPTEAPTQAPATTPDAPSSPMAPTTPPETPPSPPMEAPGAPPAEAPPGAPTEVPAPNATAGAAASCEEQFTTLDTNGDGLLTESEAPSIHAGARVDGVTIPAEGLAREDFMAACDQGGYERPALDEGAPLEGANSFTEEQARDRAVSWGYSDVSELTKDDLGIWRGTAKQGADQVNVAIDYKGNVVSTAP